MTVLPCPNNTSYAEQSWCQNHTSREHNNTVSYIEAVNEESDLVDQEMGLMEAMK